MRESMITLCFPLICVKCNIVPAGKGTMFKRGLKRCLELGPSPLRMSESVESGRIDDELGLKDPVHWDYPPSLLPSTPLSMLTSLTFSLVARVPYMSGE